LVLVRIVYWFLHQLLNRAFRDKWHGFMGQMFFLSPNQSTEGNVEHSPQSLALPYPP